MTGHLLEVSDLVVSLGSPRKRTQILHGVSMHIDAGEIVGIIGETGSGKSTLARSVAGMYRLDAGSITFDGDEIGGLTGADLRMFRRRGELQYVFQDPLLSLDPDRTIRASVAEPLAAASRADAAEVDRALEIARLDPALADRYPHQLSGGQRQRALIARGLVTRPRIVFADEPVSALDAESRIHVLDLLRALATHEGIGIGFISHDVGSVAGIADRIAVLYHGEVVETGSSSQVIREPQHPYTRLLVGSTPSLDGGGLTFAQRTSLRHDLAS